ncbi:MAG: hypothetical protein QM368_07035 [Bacillota bacterium]|jgi:hypothetical protein|nr:hypothetical protein [Bacillota bacterium]HHU29727.1 hypothetical protein [Bacillota bacterium]
MLSQLHVQDNSVSIIIYHYCHPANLLASITYAPVAREGISTMKELEIYLSNFFDESTCQKLISTRVDDEKFPLFMERDGILYCAGGLLD